MQIILFDFTLQIIGSPRIIVKSSDFLFCIFLVRYNEDARK